jgi:hypothetical protein
MSEKKLEQLSSMAEEARALANVVMLFDAETALVTITIILAEIICTADNPEKENKRIFDHLQPIVEVAVKGQLNEQEH